MRAQLLVLAGVVAVAACASPQGEATPWTIDSVRSESGTTPVGILALGTQLTLGDSDLEFRLGGASLVRDAVVTTTDTGATIELDMNGNAVALMLEQFSPERAELRWVAGGRTVVAEMSRGGEK